MGCNFYSWLGWFRPYVLIPSVILWLNVASLSGYAKWAQASETCYKHSAVYYAGKYVEDNRIWLWKKFITGSSVRYLCCKTSREDYKGRLCRRVCKTFRVCKSAGKVQFCDYFHSRHMQLEQYGWIFFFIKSEFTTPAQSLQFWTSWELKSDPLLDASHFFALLIHLIVLIYRRRRQSSSVVSPWKSKELKEPTAF